MTFPSMSLRCRTILALALFVGCIGCSDQQELASNLDTHQSIELMVALRGVGIASSRERSSSGRESRYLVAVSPAEYLRALQVMHEYRLPSEHTEQFSDITAPQGLVPNTPEMNKLRLDHALGLEVERVLSSLPGILDAKAVVRSSLMVEGTAPSVALVVRYLAPSGNMPFAVDEIKKLVMNTVPGTDADSINVNATRVFFPASALANSAEIDGDGKGTGGAAYIQLRPFPFRVAASERLKAYAQIGTLLLGAVLSGIVLGVAVMFSSRKQRRRGRKTPMDARGMVPEVVSRSTSPATSEFSEGGRRRSTTEM